jgi:predicted component of type VI protein secretion system
MFARLVALDEGPDIILDQAMVVVGRHPACDTRLDSLRVSRHHCCLTLEGGIVVVRDLGSTNGIRINGKQVEVGRLNPGDELSIAHLRYRFDDGKFSSRFSIDSSPEPPSAYPHPSDPTWIWVRRSAFDIGPLDGD